MLRVWIDTKISECHYEIKKAAKMLESCGLSNHEERQRLINNVERRDMRRSIYSWNLSVKEAEIDLWKFRQRLYIKMLCMLQKARENLPGYVFERRTYWRTGETVSRSSLVKFLNNNTIHCDGFYYTEDAMRMMDKFRYRYKDGDCGEIYYNGRLVVDVKVDCDIFK